MVDRIRLTTTTYMPLDGQWQIVLGGSVIDVPSAAAYANHELLTATEAPGTLGLHGKPTSVRNVRTR